MKGSGTEPSAMERKRVCLDLFSGLGGFSQAFEASADWIVIEVELEQQFEPDIQADILELELPDLKQRLNELLPRGMGWGDVDTILASPPCTSYSMAAVGHHYNPGYIPDSDFAMKSIFLIQHTLRLIQGIDPTYWFIENPRAMFRKFLHRCPSCNRVRFWQPTDDVEYHCPDCNRQYQNGGEIVDTVTWCQYGDNCMKPTDLGGVHPPSMQYASCKNGADCHEPAPRGSSTGTQGKEDAAARAKIPAGLSEEILEAVEADIEAGTTRPAGKNQAEITEFVPPAERNGNGHAESRLFWGWNTETRRCPSCSCKAKAYWEDMHTWKRDFDPAGVYCERCDATHPIEA